MRILLTIIAQQHRTGAEMYVRDLALELKRRGHEPAVYAPLLGELADDLRAREVPVSDRLEEVPFRPDIVHGQHFETTLQPLIRLVGVPAIHVCHDHIYKPDRTPLHPRIYRHFGVSRVCVDRLAREGAAPDRTGLLLNWVDLGRFPERPALPERPRRALVFSNYASEKNHLGVIREACRRHGIELDVVGLGVGRPIKEPGDILGTYDLVFAKAKAAMEALATGCAVVLCDFAGMGPMVACSNFRELRPLNFGFASLRDPIDVSGLVERIASYDARDAAAVCRMARSECGLTIAVDRLLEIYAEVIREHDRMAAPTIPARPRKTLAWAYRQRWFAGFRRRPWIRWLLVHVLGA